jgi:aspartate-semialdehyde dehydrogenase
VIDLTSALEDLPNARLRSPLSDRRESRLEPGIVQVIAHPAAIALALMLSRIHQAHPIRHSVVQVFEPTSERGKAGINELQQQVAALLSFRPLEKKVFDSQIAFNLLARYGDDSLETLQDIEARINRHLTTLLRGVVPAPSLRLIQAPVFHGYSFSLWIEFESRPSATALAEALASADIDVRGDDVEPPANAGVAGQSGVTAGVIEPDSSHPRGMWLWAVADNLRLVAEAALEAGGNVLGGALP